MIPVTQISKLEAEAEAEAEGVEAEAVNAEAEAVKAEAVKAGQKSLAYLPYSARSINESAISHGRANHRQQTL